MSQRNKEIVQEFIERIWNQGDIQAVDELLAGSYTIHHDPGDLWDGRTLSPEEFKQRLRISRAPFPDQKFIIQSLIAEDHEVCITWQWIGTHQEALADFEASGKVVEMSGITLYFFENDRLAGHWQVADRLSVYQQLMENP